jgi:hypothetical protein
MLALDLLLICERLQSWVSRGGGSIASNQKRAQIFWWGKTSTSERQAACARLRRPPLTGAGQIHLGPEPADHCLTKKCMFGQLKARIGRNHSMCVVACRAYQLSVSYQISYTQLRQSMLPGANELTRSAQL